MTPDHEVAIIGAGLGGIGAAIALQRAGLEDFVILERAGDVGGTWRDNTYPGIAVDIPAQAYQFSYELNPDWTRVFARGAEVKAYIDDLVAKYGLTPKVRLNSEVNDRTWDEQQNLWRLKTPTEETTARFVISAVGAFVNPKPAEIPGLEDFTGRGPALGRLGPHDRPERQARRDHRHRRQRRPDRPEGGTRAGSSLRLPAHADLGRAEVRPAYAKALRKLYRRYPKLQRRVRDAVAGGVEAGLVGLVVHHDEFGWITRLGGWLGRNVWYRLQIRDPQIRKRLTPDYEIGCKRPSVSNSYLRTFNRKNVELVSDRIERITESGVITTDGTERAIDVLILATGFRLATDPENYRRNPVHGRDGFDLASHYAEHHVRSYESVSMPGLPNHFMIFGPYGWTGGTWHDLVETASHHIVRVINEARQRGATSVEVKPEAADRWTKFATERLQRSLWHTGACATSNSYYFDHHGDTPFLRPTSSKQAWRAAKTFPLEDYVFSGPGTSAALSASDPHPGQQPTPSAGDGQARAAAA